MPRVRSRIAKGRFRDPLVAVSLADELAARRDPAHPLRAAIEAADRLDTNLNAHRVAGAVHLGASDPERGMARLGTARLLRASHPREETP
jgi:hypothetical protein